jgi:branched-chain amino acid aminotransferase
MFGPEDYATEVGTMNFFCYWTNEAGQKELLTPPLDGTILPGVTRDSILKLAKNFGINTVEKKITLSQIALASREGRLIELFGCGTAAIVSPIKKIRYEGEDIVVPLDPNDATQQGFKHFT